MKNFIEENRRAFDDEIPTGNLWNRVEKSIKVKKKGGLSFSTAVYKWSAAAAILILAGICLYVLFVRRDNGDKGLSKSDMPVLRTPVSAVDISAMAPEFAATAKQIEHSIETRQQLLKEITADVPGLYNQFSGDLAALDSSFRVLKNRALQSPGREEIIKAMLQNLQLQSELLGKQLLIIHEFKNNKTDKNEKVNSRPV